MQRFLKKYNKDALLSNIRNIEVTYNIIRNQIKKDGFVIIHNTSWGEWYLVEECLTSIHCPTQGIYNVFEELGRHSKEGHLLKHYLETRM